MRLGNSTCPAASAPCSWNTCFAMSKPIVVACSMDASFGGSSTPSPWHTDAVGGRPPHHPSLPFAHLWTPPFRQGKTLGSLLRVVGCCHLSGLRCGRNTAAGLYGSSRTGRVQRPTAPGSTDPRGDVRDRPAVLCLDAAAFGV